MGYLALRQKAVAVTEEERRDDSLRRVVSDLFEAMERYHGIGIAAPQNRSAIARKALL